MPFAAPLPPLPSSPPDNVHAQAPAANYPNKPLRLVVGFPAGGPADIFDRAIAQKLSEAAATPKDIVAKLHASLVAVLEAPDTKQRFAGHGANSVSSTPEELAAFMREETIKWGKVIKTSGIKIDQ